MAGRGARIRPEHEPPETTAAPLRSMLFVPGDSDRKLAKCESAGADALILDLEDSVAPSRKAFARGLVVEYVAAARDRAAAVWVRVNALADREFRADIESVVPARPAGIVLPKPDGPEDIALAGHQLHEIERRHGIPLYATRILPIATETPAGVFGLGRYRHGPRLAALTWGAEDLSVAIGAATNVDERGEWLPPYQLARSLCLLAAAAARVPAIDTVHTNVRDAEGLRRSGLAARRDGFAGKMAIHPEQVETLNLVFTPHPEEIASAQRIVAAFEADEGLGVVVVDGKMLDRPHLERARRILRLAAAIDALAGTRSEAAERL